jgi:hypothetical protein
MRLAAALLVALALAASSDAQVTAPEVLPPPVPVPDPIHDLLAGRWTGSGTILGQPSRVELTVERVLDGRFTRLTWVSHIGEGPKAQRFEGHAYYRRAEGGANEGTWFDSGGMVRPLRATRTARGSIEGHATIEAVVALWGTPETEQGETTYRRVSTDALEIVDRVLGTNGEWREFGRTSLTRTSR